MIVADPGRAPVISRPRVQAALPLRPRGPAAAASGSQRETQMPLGRGAEPQVASVEAAADEPEHPGIDPEGAQDAISPWLAIRPSLSASDMISSRWCVAIAFFCFSLVSSRIAVSVDTPIISAISRRV